MEKLSYALGLLIGHNLKGMNIDGLVTTEFTRAVEQVLKGEKAEMTEVQAQGMVQEFMKEQQEIAGREVREAGEKFLADNAKRDGVTTTASGLQYEVLTEAIGQKPVATDSVRCHYEGRLIRWHRVRQQLSTRRTHLFPPPRRHQGMDRRFAAYEPRIKVPFLHSLHFGLWSTRCRRCHSSLRSFGVRR